MAYRIKFEGSPEEQVFKFTYLDEALDFAATAADFGTFQPHHYEKAEAEDSYEKVWENPHKITVSIVEVDD